MGEKKNKTYAGQVADIARKDVHLSFTDRLSRMTEEEGDPYLNIFSAKSIYLARISHWIQGIYGFVFGLLLSWGYESSSFGKYRMAVVMHGAANGAALLLNVVLIRYL